MMYKMSWAPFYNKQPPNYQDCQTESTLTLKLFCISFYNNTTRIWGLCSISGSRPRLSVTSFYNPWSHQCENCCSVCSAVYPGCQGHKSTIIQLTILRIIAQPLAWCLSWLGHHSTLSSPVIMGIINQSWLWCLIQPAAHFTISSHVMAKVEAWTM